MPWQSDGPVYDVDESLSGSGRGLKKKHVGTGAKALRLPGAPADRQRRAVYQHLTRWGATPKASAATPVWWRLSRARRGLHGQLAGRRPHPCAQETRRPMICSALLQGPSSGPMTLQAHHGCKTFCTQPWDQSPALVFGEASRSEALSVWPRGSFRATAAGSLTPIY